MDWRRIVQVLLLVLLTCACYWPALDGEFLWDDEIVITHSAQNGSLHGLWQIWFSTVPFDFYPLTNSLFWAQWHWWGGQTAGYHLVNLALHVVGAFLFWRLLRALRLPGAWFAALLFAVHPVNVASVAWIAELKNVLSMAFSLASLLCFVRWRERSGTAPNATSLYLTALGCFLLAAFAKSSVVMLPCVLLLIVWWQDGRLRRRELLSTVLFFAVSLGIGLLSIWFQSHRGMSAEQLAQTPSIAVRTLTAARAVWFYLGKVVFPYPLAMLYPRWSIRADDPWVYLAPLGLVALVAGAWWARRFWGRGPLAALGCFVLGVLPISGLMHMGFFTHSNVSDHYVHLAAPAVFACVAAWLGGWHEAGGSRGRVALVAMVAVVVAASFGCLQRAGDFRSSVNLWTKTLEVSPRSFTARNNLGLAVLAHSGQDPRQLALAESHFRAALDLEPRLESAGVNLANVLRMEGRWRESADLYRRVLEIDPDAQGYNNYGVALLAAGDSAQARGAFQEALRLDPSLAGAYYNLARIEEADRHFPQAADLLRTCLRMDPDHVPALNALVSLRVDPPPGQPPPSAEEVRANVLAAEHACRLTRGHDARSLLSLSKALLLAGQPTEATALAARAYEVASAAGQTELAASVEAYRGSLAR